MNLYETLERYGFVNEDDSVRVWDLPKEKVTELYDSLYSELRSHQYDGIDGPKSRFSFVASANMRAAIGCQEPFCVRAGGPSKLRLGGAVDFFHHKTSVSRITDFQPAVRDNEDVNGAAIGVPSPKTAREAAPKSFSEV